MIGTIVAPLTAAIVVVAKETDCTAAGIIVAEGTTMTGVPEMVVVLPERPARARETGMVVGPVMMMGWAAWIWGAAAGGMVVAAGIMRKADPEMEVVLPTAPKGASDSGIVVGDCLNLASKRKKMRLF